MTTRKKTGGRKKGTPNKTTASVKAALEKAFFASGGQDALNRWAKDNPDEFYKLWGKMLPREMTADVNHTGNTGQVVIVKLPDNNRDQ